VKQQAPALHHHSEAVVGANQSPQVSEDFLDLYYFLFLGHANHAHLGYLLLHDHDDHILNRSEIHDHSEAVGVVGKSLIETEMEDTVHSRAQDCAKVAAGLLAVSVHATATEVKPDFVEMVQERGEMFHSQQGFVSSTESVLE
jgi:hypothetical protein